MPADAAPNATAVEQPAAVPPLLTAVPRPDEPYVPSNSVFKMSDSGGDTYVPEWSGLSDISEEVALSGVPVQLALTATPSEPPIPVSADVFPMLRSEEPTSEAKAPAWQVEEPLAKPVDQLFPVAPAAPAAPFASPVVAPVVSPAPVAPMASLTTPITPPSTLGSLSADVFPVAAPAAPAPVPQPSGDAFPGIVPSAAPAPAMFAEPPAAVAPVPVAEAPVAAAPVAAAPPAPAPVVEAPIAQAPVVEAPVAQAPAPIATPAPAPTAAPVVAEATVYTGPPPVAVGPDPVAPVDFQPFAASTPGATYVPHAPRPIPQPVQLGAPVAAPPAALAPAPVAAPSELVPATPSAPVEYWPTQGTPPPGTQYQPSPGDYVPFDPNAVRLAPVAVIPFSSRDPYNSASTARPGMRAYMAGPVGPTGSTWTGGLVYMLLAPLISAATFFVWTQLTTVGVLGLDSLTWLPIALGFIGLVGLASAQFDRSTLAKRGYFDLASPFWVLLIPPLIYLIVRATRLRGQGRGAAPAIGLWLLAAIAGNVLVGLIFVNWMSTPTPERVATVQTSIQQELAAKNITATVSCPSVTSFAPGSTFTCTVKTQTATLPIKVSMLDWEGDYTATPVTSTNS